ncbi:MAG: hypothetical protein HYX82_06275 [Chloroflexi bacterium]|nr:hypothetical protein [Chloroflexota bacterium]
MRILGFVLSILGIVIIAGYIAYFFFKAFFISPLPIPIKIAVPALIGGFILLLVSVGWERYKSKKREHFEEGGR